eukprot:gene8129-8999_t
MLACFCRVLLLLALISFGVAKQLRSDRAKEDLYEANLGLPFLSSKTDGGAQLDKRLSSKNEKEKSYAGMNKKIIEEIKLKEEKILVKNSYESQQKNASVTRTTNNKALSNKELALVIVIGLVALSVFAIYFFVCLFHWYRARLNGYQLMTKRSVQKMRKNARRLKNMDPLPLEAREIGRNNHGFSYEDTDYSINEQGQPSEQIETENHKRSAGLVFNFKNPNMPDKGNNVETMPGSFPDVVNDHNERLNGLNSSHSRDKKINSSRICGGVKRLQQDMASYEANNNKMARGHGQQGKTKLNTLARRNKSKAFSEFVANSIVDQEQMSNSIASERNSSSIEDTSSSNSEESLPSSVQKSEEHKTELNDNECFYGSADELKAVQEWSEVRRESRQARVFNESSDSDEDYKSIYYLSKVNDIDHAKIEEGNMASKSHKKLKASVIYFDSYFDYNFSREQQSSGDDREITGATVGVSTGVTNEACFSSSSKSKYDYDTRGRRRRVRFNEHPESKRRLFKETTATLARTAGFNSSYKTSNNFESRKKEDCLVFQITSTPTKNSNFVKPARLTTGEYVEGEVRHFLRVSCGEVRKAEKSPLNGCQEACTLEVMLNTSSAIYHEGFKTMVHRCSSDSQLVARKKKRNEKKQFKTAMKLKSFSTSNLREEERRRQAQREAARTGIKHGMRGKEELGT